MSQFAEFIERKEFNFLPANERWQNSRCRDYVVTLGGFASEKDVVRSAVRFIGDGES
jgi:hypothetical protein